MAQIWLVLVKLPPFWKESPENWFYIVEATFAIARITADESKFRHALINLDYTVLPYISDLLSDPPPRGKYDALKKRIIEAFGESQETKLRKLLREQ